MINYTGLQCPVCDQAFQENDDIVVCPQCGAPHHRDCYQKNGRCALADKHGTDEDWSHQTHEQEKAGTKECPRCHHMNQEEALFCKECGQSLQYYAGNVGRNPYASPPNPQGAPPNSGTSYGQQPPQESTDGSAAGYNNGYPVSTNPFDPMGGVHPSEAFDGVEAGDLAMVVQSNTRYYLPVFSRIKNFNRSRFSFVAFLFNGGWFLYRKQYATGIILTAINACFVAAQLVLNNLVVHPILQNIDSTLDINSSVYQIHEVIPKLMGQNPGAVVLCLLPFFCALCQLALYIFSGIKANRFYYKHCVKTVKKIKEQQISDSGAYERTLRQKGGVNIALAACLLGLYFLLNLFNGFLF